jgi:hypothetical protein
MTRPGVTSTSERIDVTISQLSHKRGHTSCEDHSVILQVVVLEFGTVHPSALTV